jgi:hypothetical protein
VKPAAFEQDASRVFGRSREDFDGDGVRDEHIRTEEIHPTDPGENNQR